MKAIILAAGRGYRMNKYTKNLPKGMLVFNNKTLIENQIEILNSSGIKDIAIVTGYQASKIKYSNIKYFYNKDWESTNMIESLMCCGNHLNGNVIITYSDIIYTKDLMQQIINTKYNIGVAVDKDWKRLWEIRYGTINYDLESCIIRNNKIIEIGGVENNPNNIDFRYIGILKFSKKGIEILKEIYNIRKVNNLKWTQSGKEFKKGYMTDILNEIINSGYNVHPIITSGNWLEFDTNEDYEKLTEYYKINELKSF